MSLVNCVLSRLLELVLQVLSTEDLASARATAANIPGWRRVRRESVVEGESETCDGREEMERKKRGSSYWRISMESRKEPVLLISGYFVSARLF